MALNYSPRIVTDGLAKPCPSVSLILTTKVS